MWQAYGARACRPGFDALDFVCRAITPTYSKRRYNTRFFLADGARATGKLAGNGELEDLNWWPLAELPRLAIVDVTEFVLTEALRRWQQRIPIGSEPARLFCYRGDCARWRDDRARPLESAAGAGLWHGLTAGAGPVSSPLREFQAAERGAPWPSRRPS